LGIERGRVGREVVERGGKGKGGMKRGRGKRE